jgi:hypothetical protein
VQKNHLMRKLDYLIACIYGEDFPEPVPGDHLSLERKVA